MVTDSTWDSLGFKQPLLAYNQQWCLALSETMLFFWGGIYWFILMYLKHDGMKPTLLLGYTGYFSPTQYQHGFSPKPLPFQLVGKSPTYHPDLGGWSHHFQMWRWNGGTLKSSILVGFSMKPSSYGWIPHGNPPFLAWSSSDKLKWEVLKWWCWTCYQTSHFLMLQTPWNLNCSCWNPFKSS